MQWRCTRCARNVTVRTMHMQSSVHNAFVLYCANVHTAHSTILLMHTLHNAHMAMHRSSAQWWIVRAPIKVWSADESAQSATLVLWIISTVKYIAEGHIYHVMYFLQSKLIILFYFAHHSAWWPQKKYFPGQRRQSACVWLCPGSWHRSQSSAKREHISAQLEWGSNWIDCRSNGNLIPGPKYH